MNKATHDTDRVTRDPVCGMRVDAATAAARTRYEGREYLFCSKHCHDRFLANPGARSFYFRSAGCQRTFDSPEQELKSMRTRVAIALTGVLALAIMRAGAFIALACAAGRLAAGMSSDLALGGMMLALEEWRNRRRNKNSPLSFANGATHDD